MIIKIKHIAWRNGRPRFAPGPTVRRLGFKSEDLKHIDGRWFSLEETRAWINKRCQEIAAARNGETRPPQRTNSSIEQLSLADLISDFIELAGAEIVNGRKHRKPLSPKTVQWYRNLARILETDHATTWRAPARELSAHSAERLIDNIETARGLSTARGVRALLSAAWGRLGSRNRLPANPLAAVRLPVPEPRLRYGSLEEMQTLIAAADDIDRPEIGDSIMLGLMTGQRQGDRLSLTLGQEVDGMITFRQSKGGAIVPVPATPQLRTRLTALRDRRRGWRVDYLNIILDERRRRPFHPRHYGNCFAAVRTHAALTHPSLADFHDQDLRDTAVTWLALAGCTVPEISSITGHTLQSAHTILKHYLGQHPGMTSTAIGKLVTWLDGKGIEL